MTINNQGTADEIVILSPEEFIDIWKCKHHSNPAYSRFYKEDYNEILDFNTRKDSEKTIIVVFKNVEVTGPIILKEDYTYFPVVFSNIKVSDYFIISGGTFLGFNSANGGPITADTINISGGRFKNNVNIGGLKAKILITSATFETTAHIRGFNNSELAICDGEFIRGIKLTGDFQNITIEGGKFNADLRLDNITVIDNFQILGGDNADEIGPGGRWIRQERLRSIEFDKCGIVKVGNFRIRGKFVISNISPEYIKLMYDLIFEDHFSFIENLIIIDYNRSLFIQGSPENPLLINTLKISKCTFLSGNIFRLKELYIGDIEFDNVLSQGNLYLNKISGGKKFRLIQADDGTYNPGKHLFNDKNVEHNPIESIFQLTETDLGNSTMFNCDFSSFKVFFESSKIDNLYLSGTKFPNKINTQDANNFLDKKIAYSQFKKVFEKNDVHRSMVYAFEEMETYRKIIKTTPGYRGDRYVLWLNNFTSRHNTNWFRPLFQIFIVTLISYLLLGFSLGLKPHLSYKGLENFVTLSGYYLTYLNPIHKTDFLKNSFLGLEWNAAAEFIDGFTRIINSFLIYQFIQAFRKFGKIK